MSDDVDARRQFGAELKSHRELYGETGMTQTELARKCKTSKSTISRLEATAGRIPPEIPALLDQVFATDGLFQRLYEQIVAEGFSVYSRKRIELEPKAAAIVEWSPTVVPGLLQTAGYAYALLQEGMPRATEPEVQRKVQQRLNRQELLRGPTPPDLSVVICESVVRRTVGGPEVMRGQLKALLEIASRRTAILQILPLNAEYPHRLMDGSLSIVTTHDLLVVAYTEGIQSGSIVEDPGQVRALERSYDVLTASALSRDASARMIRSTMEAL